MPDLDLDVRFLAPPEPFERIVEALDRLTPGDCLRILIHREPHPLYQMLRSSGYAYRPQQRDDGMWLIEVRQADAAAG